ncbi:hypothetical protein BJ508DRAFT_377082 [Ascobolus immersus RN42]|uniref:CBF1-interacting co-repressor CIR N-terminal domain-containing protein n=1 Tax=Ascobolus immersus RN42 TaxID=1160509 RepID=A0A3N4I2Q5_ASCIM|nr:hypothetical protein BJ508DRAFT_377082 [Ascobolus immersus RN42]
MPLSLLAKKSWNVTNPANVARVRRDEALAKAREEEEDRRLKLSESERNMMELRRGMMANTLDANGVPMIERFDAEIRGDKDKKRKRGRKGEDDDEWERARAGTAVVDVGLTGKDGHFNLFADLESGEREKDNPTKSYAKKVQEITAPQGDALNQSNTEKRPWYASVDKVGEKALQTTEEQIAKKERVQGRIIARDDPMAEVKKSLAIMKDLEEERRREREEREGLLDDFSLEERRRKGDKDRHRDRKRRKEDDDDSERRRRRRERHRSRRAQGIPQVVGVSTSVPRGGKQLMIEKRGMTGDATNMKGREQIKGADSQDRSVAQLVDTYFTRILPSRDFC